MGSNESVSTGNKHRHFTSRSMEIEGRYPQALYKLENVATARSELLINAECYNRKKNWIAFLPRKFKTVSVKIFRTV
ncbi:UNVERIFIED_CONTAM: hypothetical protein ACS92_02715 [Bacillus cereus]